MRSSRLLRVLCVLPLLGLAPVGQARAGDQYALLVAVADYTKLNPLHYTCNDQTEFRKALIDSGFPADHIVLMCDKPTNPDLTPAIKNIRAQLALLLAKAGADDTVIVALSGHGVDFVKEKHSYFCPIDCDLTDTKTLLGLDDLYKELEDCKARQKLLLVDACRNDPGFGKGLPGKALEKLDLDSLTRPQVGDVPAGIVALFSCSKGQKSYEADELKHGVFFNYFIEGWRGKAPHEGKLTLDDVIDYTVKQTQAYAKGIIGKPQLPQKKYDFSGAWVLNDSLSPVPPVTIDVPPVGDPMTLRGHGGAIRCVAFSADGKYLASGAADNTVRVWDAATGKGKYTLECQSVAVSLAFDPHGHYLAAGAGDGAVRVWDLQTGNLLWGKADLGGAAKGVAFSPDGERVAVAAGAVWMMDAATGRNPWHYADTALFQAVAYSPNGDALAVGSSVGRLVLFTAAGDPVRQTQAYGSGGVGVIAYSPDGTLLACGSLDKTVKLFDPATLKHPLLLKGHDGGVNALVYSADGKYLGTASDDTTIKVWDCSTGKEKTSFPSHGGAGLAACFSPDAKHIGVASPDKTVKVWSVDFTKL